MSGFFIRILNMSLSASWVALAVMLIRLALKKVPKIYSYALWAVVFFRLVCPFTIQLPVSPVPVQPQTIPQDILYSEQPSIQSGVEAVDRAVNTAIGRSLPSVSPANSVNPVQIGLKIGTYLWLTGVLVLALYGMISYLHLKKRVMTAIRLRDNLYETDLIKTPFVLGLIRTKIYIPTGLNEKEMEYVIRHEQTHIRRLDYLIKPFAFLVTSIHWFNPIVWVSYALMSRDMELSADECVIKHYDYDFDIRRNYSHSLLALSVKKSRLLSPLAFGGTDVKARIKNILSYKKPGFWVSLIAAAMVAVVSFFLMAGKPMEALPENMPNQGAEPSPILQAPSGISEGLYPTEYDSVKIEFLSSMMGFKPAKEFETTDLKIVAAIDSALSASQASSEKPDLNNNHANQYQIALSNEVGGYSCKLYYDTLYDQAYIEKDGGLYEAGTDFARYIDSFLENTGIIAAIDETDAAALFKAYGWTLDYQISEIKHQLNEINILSAFDPSAYYFAYNNELSKDIGLDMSPYATADIKIEIYRIHEPMPDEFYPIQNSRGIVVKNGDSIIGAFISAGRHSTFNACSLKGNSFERATGQTLYEWLKDRIEADSIDTRLSQLEPEQVIAEYFGSLDKKEAQTARDCLSKKVLLGNLTANIVNDELFNPGIILPLAGAEMGTGTGLDNLKSAKLMNTELIGEPDINTKIYRITADLQYNQVWSGGSGEQIWDCRMVYESPQTGWKIEGFGH